MRDLIVRILKEFKWKDGPNGGEPDLPPQKRNPRGTFKQASPGQYHDYEYHGKSGFWKIHYDPPPIPIRDMDWHYTHDDYDGPGDSRHGHCRSPEDCWKEIEDEHED